MVHTANRRSSTDRSVLMTVSARSSHPIKLDISAPTSRLFRSTNSTGLVFRRRTGCHGAKMFDWLKISSFTPEPTTQVNAELLRAVLSRCVL